MVGDDGYPWSALPGVKHGPRWELWGETVSRVGAERGSWSGGRGAEEEGLSKPQMLTLLTGVHSFSWMHIPPSAVHPVTFSRNFKWFCACGFCCCSLIVFMFECVHGDPYTVIPASLECIVSRAHNCNFEERVIWERTACFVSLFNFQMIGVLLFYLWISHISTYTVLFYFDLK